MTRPNTTPDNLGICDRCNRLWNLEHVTELQRSLSDFAEGGIFPYGGCPDPDCGGNVFLARNVYHVAQNIERLKGEYFIDAVVLANTARHAKQMILHAFRDGGYTAKGIWHDLTDGENDVPFCDDHRLTVTTLGTVPPGPFEPHVITIRFGADHDP